MPANKGFDWASFLSPTVANARLQEEADRKALIQKVVLTGLQNGSIGQEEAVPALKQLGLDDLVIKQNLPSSQPPQELANLGGGPPTALSLQPTEISAIGQKPAKIEQTRLTKLQSARDRLLALPRTASRIKQIGEIDKVIKKMGSITGRTPTDLLLGKKVQNDIQDRLLKIKLSKDRLNAIKDNFQKKFTEAFTRGKVKLTALGEKVGIKPSKADKKLLDEFTTFARSSLENTNQHIRDRTGAVMNKDEIPRLMGEMPNMGTGVFDGDSATVFMSKLDGVLNTLQAAEDRLSFAEANGLGTDPEVFTRGLPLNDFKNLPPRPPQFRADKWNAMPPRQRKRLIELLNKRKNNVR